MAPFVPPPEQVLDLMEAINRKPGPIEKKFTTWTTLLASRRRAELLDDLVAAEGWKVLSGPFAGLDLEGCPILPLHLLGGYESSLHDSIEALIARRPERVLNIGCSFGYYAAGLARRLPQARVAAHDIDAGILETCRGTARRNGVADRMDFGGEVRGEDFAAFPAGRTLVFCDIEGGERDLLDPGRFPALRGFDLVVEIHPNDAADGRALLEDRFSPTHDVRFIPNDRVGGLLPPVFWERDSLDQAIAVWEGRGHATPWLVMTRRSA